MKAGTQQAMQIVGKRAHSSSSIQSACIDIMQLPCDVPYSRKFREPEESEDQKTMDLTRDRFISLTSFVEVIHILRISIAYSRKLVHS